MKKAIRKSVKKATAKKTKITRDSKGKRVQLCNVDYSNAVLFWVRVEFQRHIAG